MSFKFLGENAPELARFPADQRRRMYFKAVKASYRSVKTWAGVVVVLAASECGTVILICGVVVLGMLQISAIRDNLKRFAESGASAQNGLQR